MKPLNVALARILRDRRKRSGLTQKSVALKIGYTSAQLLSNAERSACSLPLSKLAAICDIYGINRALILNTILHHTKKDLKAKLGIRP